MKDLLENRQRLSKAVNKSHLNMFVEASIDSQFVDEMI
jgi:hypothetical protein